MFVTFLKNQSVIYNRDNMALNITIIAVGAVLIIRHVQRYFANMYAKVNRNTIQRLSAVMKRFQFPDVRYTFTLTTIEVRSLVRGVFIGDLGPYFSNFWLEFPTEDYQKRAWNIMGVCLKSLRHFICMKVLTNID